MSSAAAPVAPLVTLSQPMPVGPAMLARKRTKLEVVDTFLRTMVERGVDVSQPGFAAGIRQHFETLPTRYALDVDIDIVLSHKRVGAWACGCAWAGVLWPA